MVHLKHDTGQIVWVCEGLQLHEGPSNINTRSSHTYNLCTVLIINILLSINN